MDKVLVLSLLYLVLAVSTTLVKKASALSVVLALDHMSSVVCKQTPYPDLCASLVPPPMTTLSTDLQGETPFRGFRNLALQATLTRAEQARRFVISTMKVSKLATATWTDCMELMDDSVSQLTRALTSKNPDDAQTWLSAAVANHETCRTGFVELNSSSLVLLTGSTNFPKFLSNSLAINNMHYYPAGNRPVSSPPAGTGGRKLLHNNNNNIDSDDGFPEWVSPTERKLLQSSSPAVLIQKADLVVAKDGSGDYKTIAEALAASAKMRGGKTTSATKRFVIYVKSGVYKENVEITKSMKNLMFWGDGIDSTIVTGSRNVKDGSTTFRSATLAGPQKGQAVCLRSGADLSIFYRCSFGDAAAVLQNCNIYVRRPAGKTNTVTAQGRSDPNENTGISVHNSRITAASELKPVLGSYKTYLGRPWRPYARTVFMKCTLDGLIHQAGWLEWNSKADLKTLYYGEYANSGAGAGTGNRVNWPGFHVMTTSDATKFTVENFLSRGSSWIKSSGVPFTPEL